MERAVTDKVHTAQDNDMLACFEELPVVLKLRQADAQRHSRLTHWLLHHISNYFDQSRTCN